MLHHISVKLPIVMHIKICKQCIFMNKVWELPLLHTLLADVVVAVGVYICLGKHTVDASVFPRCVTHLPLGKTAAVHPERPPSDMTSSAL